MAAGPGQDNLLNSKLNVRVGKKDDLSNFERGMLLLRVFHNLLSYLNFHAQPFLGFTKNGVKRGKPPVYGSPVGEHALLMLEVRGEWVQADRRATLK